MTIVSMMRSGTLAIVVAASALAGCTSQSGMVAATNSSIVPTAPATGPYSGADSVAALDAAMTSDNGGE